MDVSSVLASQGEPHGTVITADFQAKGRGRIRERSWDMERGENLPFTILLRYARIEDIPPALTLRAGLAVALAVENFAPALAGRVRIKWPNDVLIAGEKTEAAQKVAGILAEADGGNVHIGIGVNVAQKNFPGHLQEKATSVSLAANRKIESGERFTLLEKILARLYEGIGTLIAASPVPTLCWRERIEERLYKKGERVCFMQGAVDSGEKVTGTLFGIGPGGELLIVPDGETEARGVVTGELTWKPILQSYGL
jgi:BirA family biotin operon repressor/biotin-[acetyl-CoA-carboxylase] ligase